MRYITKILIFFLLLTNLYSVENLEKITVQLSWKYQFQHAGFIMAIEKGFYKDVGLDVELLEYQNKIDIADEVISKRADFGISNSSLIAKDGILEPVVLLATYLQKSPLVLVTNLDIKKPKDLSGKRIMLTKEEHENSALALLLNHFFIDYTYVPHTFNISDFKDKKIEALSAFTSNELYDLEKDYIFYNVIDPADYGFVTNIMNLFASYEYTKNNTLQIKRFLKATKKGWVYSFDNISETVNIIHQKYAPNKSVEALTYEAEITQGLMLLNLYDIGETNKELVTRTYKQLTRSGKLKKGQEVNILTFKDIVQKQKDKSFQLSEKERKYLQNKGVINLCVDPNWMPFEAIKDGKHTGISSDYFEIFREKLKVDIKLYPTKNWVESLDAMKKRKCDVLSAATETKERLAYMDFTQAYIKSPIVLATKNDKPFISDIENVKHKKIGVVKGYFTADILKSKYDGINIIEVKNIFDGLSKVESGELYGYVDNLTTMAYSIQKNFIGSIKVSARLDEDEINSIATRSDEPILNSIFEKIIVSIQDNQKQEILNRWVSVRESVGFDYSLFWKVFAFLGVFIILSLIYVYQLKKYSKKLKELSTVDALTQVSNRLKIDEVLEMQQKTAIRYKSTCGIILLDIDDFKNINDLHGHLVGDEVLKQLSLTIKYNIRGTDTVGRWGGEEFLVICPHTDIENLKNVAENIREKIDKAIFNKKQHITASFGLSCLDGVKDIEQVINEADKALYISKLNGKNQVTVFSPSNFDL